MERRHPLAECESCPLNVPDAVLVPTRPATGKCTLAVVGEAPGYQEAMYGQPFVGASGQLLKKVLKHYRYKPSEVLFTNACLCRPKDNATPPKAAVNACRRRLLSELATSGAGDILALGGTAVSAVMDDSRSITTLRVGPPKASAHLLAGLAKERGSNPPRVVPTWHPAYCLRNSDAFPTMVSDIGKLRDLHIGNWKAPTWVVAYTEEHALQILDQITLEAVHVAFDIEVDVEKDFAFAHPNTYDLLCVGLQYKKGVAFVLSEEVLKIKVVIDRLGEVLRAKKLIAHNGKFDCAGLYPHVGGLELAFDTMLAHYALDERPGTHGLKILAVEKLGAPKYDDDIKQYMPGGKGYGSIPRPILYQYNAYDVSCTWDLFELFQNALDRDGVRRVHDFMVAASNQLMYLELNGIAIDREYSNQLQGDYLLRLEAYEERFNKIVQESTRQRVRASYKVTEGKTDVIFSDDTPRTQDDLVETVSTITSINPRSPKQIKEYLETQGIRTPSTDVDHLTALLGKVSRQSGAGRFIAELLKYRREQKLYGTYVKGIRQRTYRGRVYTTYLLHGTTSGRLASRNPNLQNIVRDKPIRRQFSVSSPDNVLIQFDFKQAEGRVITHLAQDEYLRSIFADLDRDLFNELSDGLYGPGNWTKEERVRTKAFFYGLSYGREAYSIAMEYGLSPQEAERRLRSFMDLIPATARWQQAIRQQVLSGDPLVTPFGRKRRFALITNENQKEVLNEALSFLPQSTASDICLDALVHIRPRLKGIGWLRMTIHDALVAECPKKNFDQVAAIMQEEMVAAGARYTNYVPFPVDMSFGQTWGDL